MRLESDQLLDQNLKMFTQQWLATSEANFLDTVFDEKSCHSSNFFEVQKFDFWSKTIVLVEY
jgi:hypothetical protein